MRPLFKRTAPLQPCCSLSPPLLHQPAVRIDNLHRLSDLQTPVSLRPHHSPSPCLSLLRKYHRVLFLRSYDYPLFTGRPEGGLAFWGTGTTEWHCDNRQNGPNTNIDLLVTSARSFLPSSCLLWASSWSADVVLTC